MATEHSLEGRVAVVTGAGVRVGRAIAEALAAQGADVVVHFAHSRQGAEEVAQAIRARGRRAALAQADLADPAQVARVFAEADALGGCDLLVNSAAIFERKGLEAIDDAAWRRMLDTNLSAPFFCCRAAAPSLRRKGGDIVNILDVGGAMRAWKGYAHYCSAKAGLAMLTRCLALELAPGVRVNGVAPGTVLFPESYDEGQRREILEKIPLGREGSPRDIAQAVLFLVAGGGYVTGQILAVDGGRSLS
jgi:pteridine reductase